MAPLCAEKSNLAKHERKVVTFRTDDIVREQVVCIAVGGYKMICNPPSRSLRKHFKWRTVIEAIFTAASVLPAECATIAHSDKHERRESLGRALRVNLTVLCAYPNNRNLAAIVANL